MTSTIHDVSESFSLDEFLAAREKTIQAVNNIRDKVYVGMSEDEGQEIIKDVLKEMGAQKNWHPSKFRIGKNTNKSFRDISDPSITLQENDIFFVDIGPVWNGHEGDYGDTFCIGENTEYEKISKACKEVFYKTQEVWREQNLSGVKLYDFCESYAKSLGYNLNNRMKGHRVGDFPHHLFYRGGLSETEETPCDNLWILEIHLVSLDGNYGSFFEDILTRDNNA